MCVVRFISIMAAAGLLAASAAGAGEARTFWRPEGAGAVVVEVTPDVQSVAAPAPGAPLPPGAAVPMSVFVGRGGPPHEKVKVTYLGVATSGVPEAMADQLKLARGTGLVVDFIEPESPAATAGIRKHDILTKLDDQLLVNAEQLSVLVRNHKPNDKVSVTLVREGKEQKVPAVLGETERETGPEGDVIRFGSPEAWKDYVFRLLPGQPVPGARPGGGAWAGGTAGGASSSSCSYADGEHTLTLTAHDGEKYLVAKDRDGKAVFEGPIQTKEQREKVPPEVLKKLEKMERSMKHPAPPAPPPMPGATLPPGAGPSAGPARGGEVRIEVRTDAPADDGVTLVLTTAFGHQRLVAKDKDGKVIFEGPVDTEEQRSKLPEPIRRRLKNLSISGTVIMEPGPEGCRD